MGDMAEAILDGIFDPITGEYTGFGDYRESRPWFPPHIYKKINAVRRELAILIEEKHKSCNTDKERNKAINAARSEINLKYGKGWRHGIFNSTQPSV